MKRDELIHIVGEELEHIPRDYRGSYQNAFRGAYNTLRRSHLARMTGKKAYDVAIEVEEIVRKQDPHFIAKFDKDWFFNRNIELVD